MEGLEAEETPLEGSCAPLKLNRATVLPSAYARASFMPPDHDEAAPHSSLPASMNDNHTAVSLQCASSNSSPVDCPVIPGNPDFSGIGVRVAFYLQSFTNGIVAAGSVVLTKYSHCL